MAPPPVHPSPPGGVVQLTAPPSTDGPPPPPPPSGAHMYAGRQLTSADVAAITEAGSKGGVFLVRMGDLYSFKSTDLTVLLYLLRYGVLTFTLNFIHTFSVRCVERSSATRTA